MKADRIVSTTIEQKEQPGKQVGAVRLSNNIYIYAESTYMLFSIMFLIRSHM